MAQQIKFYKRNKIDLLTTEANITVTDAAATNTGQSFVDFVRNRSNDSAWITTGSNDAANTQLDVFLGESKAIDEIFLIGHNFKAFTIQYFDGVVFQDFSTAISETTNSDFVTNFTFTSQETDQIRIIITGTQTADADKVLRQLVLTEKIATGQLEGFPVIKRPRVSTSRKVSNMLSGKVNVVEGVESFSCSLEVRNWNIVGDLDIVEDLYFRREGFLMWLSGGEETQFGTTARKAYRLQDLFLVRPTNEYSPEYVRGIYVNGLKMKMNLAEAIE